jgi:excisionase family DNA binding protein
MKEDPTIKIYWDNPPGKKSGVSIQRAVAGQVYERRVSAQGLLSSSETAAALRITLRHLYNLVKDGKLEPVREGDRLYFRLSDVKTYRARKRRGSGKSEAWLIN